MSSGTTKAYICGIGMVTAVGDNAAMTAASVRAGINRYRESNIINKNLSPMKLALVPDNILPPLNKQLSSAAYLTAKQKRMLCLSQLAIDEALSNIPSELHAPLYIAVSEQLPDLPPSIRKDFLDHLHIQTNSKFAPDSSIMYTTGRVGGLIALEAAMITLAQDTYNVVIVGGVDSYLDLMLLGTLDRDDRVSADNVLNGFTPGEGAGFLILANQAAVNSLDLHPMATVYSPAITTEPGHRYSSQPFKGEGLAQAFTLALENAESPPVKTIFSSLNGENFGAKEYGVAVTRNQTLLDTNVKLEHPADCFGDIGAAFAPVLLGISAIGMMKSYIESPSLVYTASEQEYRGAVVVNLTT